MQSYENIWGNEKILGISQMRVRTTQTMLDSYDAGSTDFLRLPN